MHKLLKFPFYAKAALILLGMFGLLSMLYYGQHIIVPIIYSVIIAIVLSPVVDIFTKKGMNRVLAIGLTIILVIFITFTVIAAISMQARMFGDSFPKLIDKFNAMLDTLVAWASARFNISVPDINSWITETRAELLSGSRSAIGQTLMNTGSVLVVLVLIPVYIFMILYYQPLLIEFIHKLFTADNQNQVADVLTATKRIIRSYLVGLLLEFVIVAALNSAALLILGIQYAILLGIIGAILNVIPLIGGFVAVALPVIIALATKSPSSCIWVVVSYVIIQFIDNHYIIPKVVASKVKINALVSVIVVLSFGALWGIPGMFLSIPLTAIVKVIFDHIQPLKPWGFLLGDTMPAMQLIKFPFKKNTAHLTDQTVNNLKT
jgi:predicted PurR-regulated permease PerM